MLTLTIKKKWYDMILSGKKKEEYREIKPYYDTRLANAFGFILVNGEIVRASKLGLDELSAEWPVPLVFRNGYSKDAPKIETLCTISIGTGKPEWGAEPGKRYYILEIKEVRKINGHKGAK